MEEAVPPLRILVVGGGIIGLSSAWLLAQQQQQQAAARPQIELRAERWLDDTTSAGAGGA